MVTSLIGWDQSAKGMYGTVIQLSITMAGQNDAFFNKLDRQQKIMTNKHNEHLACSIWGALSPHPTPPSKMDEKSRSCTSITIVIEDAQKSSHGE